MAKTRSRRGFTLIELMVTAALIGILSSVALPMYLNMTLRTRKSEREVVFPSIRRSVAVVLSRDGAFPAEYTGPQNPPGDPGVQKRVFQLGAGMETWQSLNLTIEGPVYHSYSFVAVGNEFTITAVGDLDGDGTQQFKIARYVLRDGDLTLLPSTADAPNPEFIPAGDIGF